MNTPRVLILTDETKTFEEGARSNTLFDMYSGSFKAVKSFYKKLKEKGLDVELKILLDSNSIVDAFNELKSNPHVSIFKFLSDINRYDAMVILLSKNRLLYFISEYRKNSVNFRGDVFIIGPESVKNEINMVLSAKTRGIYFFKRVGVARLNKNYSNIIIQTLMGLNGEGIKNG